MILPLVNAVALKATTSMKSAPGAESGIRPGGRRARRSATRTGLLMIGLLAAGAAMLRIAKRRSR